MMSQKYALAAAVGVLVVIAGIWVFEFRGKTQLPVPAVVIPSPMATSTYASSTLGVTLVYPKSFVVNENYAYDQFGPKKLIRGVKFLIPETMATGTNLSSFDTGVSIEQLPRALHCTGDIYLAANVKAELTNISGINYSVATSSGAAAGNMYEETVYALSDSKPCTSLRYFIHSSNIENYGTSTVVHAFDHAALLKDFDSIRDSLTLTR